MTQWLLLYVESGKEEWLTLAQKNYEKKINYFGPFQIKKIKSSPAKRESHKEKVQFEGQQILKALMSEDFVVVLDEAGQAIKSSIAFSGWLEKTWHLQKKRVVFVIGGAFGLSREVKSRAQVSISLSSLTFNHHVAQLVFLEQLYRSFTILKKIPYHNE